MECASQMVAEKTRVLALHTHSHGTNGILGDAWDPRKVFIRGGLTALEGIDAFGAGGVASLVSWEGGKTIKIGKKLINVPETVAQNFVSDIFGNPSGWLLDLIMDYFYG